MLELPESSGMSILISDTAVSLPAPALRQFITEYAGFRVSGLPPYGHFGLPSSDVDLIISLGPPIDVVQNAQLHATAVGLYRISEWPARCACNRAAGTVMLLACTSSSNHTVFERFWALRAPKYHRSSSRGQYVAPAFRDPGSGVCLEAQRHQSTARNRLGVAETAENPRVCADPTARGRNRLERLAFQRPISRRDRRDA